MFAATKSKSFSGFITSFVIYAVVLMIVIAVATWLLKTIGLQPRETFASIQCPPGQMSVQKNGENTCVTGGDNVNVYPSSS